MNMLTQKQMVNMIKGGYYSSGKTYADETRFKKQVQKHKAYAEMLDVIKAKLYKQ
jgi:hypothetical protein